MFEHFKSAFSRCSVEQGNNFEVHEFLLLLLLVILASSYAICVSEAVADVLSVFSSKLTFFFRLLFIKNIYS